MCCWSSNDQSKMPLARNQIRRPRRNHLKGMDMIQPGEKLPEATLYEFIEDEREGCTLGPNSFDVRTETAGKRVVIFGLPGAFTPTCSGKHVPGYVEQAETLRKLGVNEVWCVSVNDAFVMGAWGRDQNVAGKVRMMGDGSAALTRALGLDQDLSARGMGVRSQRYAMIVDDGVVTVLQLEAPGKFEVSDAASVIATLQKG
jgi:peroxiredoxin